MANEKAGFTEEIGAIAAEVAELSAGRGDEWLPFWRRCGNSARSWGGGGKGKNGGDDEERRLSEGDSRTVNGDGGYYRRDAVRDRGECDDGRVLETGKMA
jgi:hypothetical protein